MAAFQIELSVISCANCFMQFAVDERFLAKRRNDRETFYCPNGHHNVYRCQSDVEKAKSETLLAQSALNEARHAQLVAERSRDKAIADKKKLERRIQAGVCPCCNRTFRDLATHMKHLHPKGIEGRDTKMLTDGRAA